MRTSLRDNVNRVLVVSALLLNIMVLAFGSALYTTHHHGLHVNQNGLEHVVNANHYTMAPMQVVLFNAIGLGLKTEVQSILAIAVSSLSIITLLSLSLLAGDPSDALENFVATVTNTGWVLAVPSYIAVLVIGLKNHQGQQAYFRVWLDAGNDDNENSPQYDIVIALLFFVVLVLLILLEMIRYASWQQFLRTPLGCKYRNWREGNQSEATNSWAGSELAMDAGITAR